MLFFPTKIVILLIKIEKIYCARMLKRYSARACLSKEKCTRHNYTLASKDMAIQIHGIFFFNNEKLVDGLPDISN
jgi:hypothetical protein